MSSNTEPAWYQNLLRINQATSKFQPQLHTDPQENSITLKAGPTEMLRVAEDGFYVRGVRLTQDNLEARQVYEAFSEWLNWQILTDRR